MFMSNIFRIYLGWRSQVILKIIVTVKSEKGNKSTRKDVDKSVDIIEKISEYMESKIISQLTITYNAAISDDFFTFFSSKKSKKQNYG